MSSILCSNARAKVAQMVKASTVKHLEDPVLNPGSVSYLFSPKKGSRCIATKAHKASQRNSYLVAIVGHT